MTTHRERIQTCLAGEIPDQTPVALWRHFPVDDQRPEDLAAAVYHVSPPATAYHVSLPAAGNIAGTAGAPGEIK